MGGHQRHRSPQQPLHLGNRILLPLHSHVFLGIAPLPSQVYKLAQAAASRDASRPVPPPSTSRPRIPPRSVVPPLVGHQWAQLRRGGSTRGKSSSIGGKSSSTGGKETNRLGAAVFHARGRGGRTRKHRLTVCLHQPPPQICEQRVCLAKQSGGVKGAVSAARISGTRVLKRLRRARVLLPSLCRVLGRVGIAAICG